MENASHRLTHLLAGMMFCLITPFLLVPGIAKLCCTRLFISLCFGRAYGNRYEDVIASFGEEYGAAMAEGLAEAGVMAEGRISRVVDCGAGTGYVTRQAAGQFPHATFIALDLLYGMLVQARENCGKIPTDVLYVQADVFALPLADGSADLLLAQNTMPRFAEFARVCRPGGMVLYVDSSAGPIADLAKRLVIRHGLFARVTGGRVGAGFYVLAQTKKD